MPQPVETITKPPTNRVSAQSPAAERMRAHRQRRREGIRCLTVQLFDTEIDELVRRGLLKDVARHDPEAVRQALYDHLNRTLAVNQ